jgi:RNA polymerase sigma factor (sigma-70 family)
MVSGRSPVEPEPANPDGRRAESGHNTAHVAGISGPERCSRIFQHFRANVVAPSNHGDYENGGQTSFLSLELFGQGEDHSWTFEGKPQGHPVPYSTTHWVQQLKAGNRQAAQELWERYYGRLVALARKKLNHRAVNFVDEDDIAQSAFASFYRAAEHGRFPQLADRNDLWRLLIVIAQRKISGRVRYDNRRKRRSGPEAYRTDPVALEDIAADNPTPDLCVAAIESFRKLLDRLNDNKLRAVALLKMEGYTNEEIAHRLDCSPSTIERKLRRIRHEWAADGEADQERDDG